MRELFRPTRSHSLLGVIALVSCAHGIDALDTGRLGEGGQGGLNPAGSAGTLLGSTSSGTGGSTGSDTSGGGVTGSGGSGAGGNGGGGNGGGGTPVSDASAGSTGTSGASGAAGAAGAMMDAMSEPPPPPICPTCPLRAQYQSFQDGQSVRQIEIGFSIMNAAANNVALNMITLRYWYTADATGVQQALCVGAAVGCPAVVLSTHAVAPVRATADTYLEIAFMGTAMLAPSTNSGEVRVSLAGSNTLSYDQRNDYSFQSTGAVYVETPRVTAYIGGTLAWGTEPP